ncbi:hypothetical protein AHF37_01276 [Paragonimus kellicotti]|nr:hypothetical protein AHF37_01276 [Paragonimus kellicotti]
MDVCALELEDDLLQSAFVGDSARFSRFPLDSETVNYQDSHKRSVLHAAAYSAWCPSQPQDLHWLTALHRACASNADGVVKLLLAHGAIRNLHDKAWHTPLHVAAANGSLECVRLLTNVYVNVSDRMGHTPLHHAVLGGHTEVSTVPHFLLLWLKATVVVRCMHRFVVRTCSLSNL